jgi:glucosamine--fructose-6-phosphate aminotransferase (isomerizing)
MTNSLVLKEALSIPSVIGKFAFIDKNPYQEIANLISQKKIKYIVTVARGTSDCAALYSSYIFAKYLGLPSYSMPPSIITLEKSKFDFANALVIVISQSGKSTDLIECEKKSQEMGAITLLISNNENSPIINSANYFFSMFAGEEKSVAATKSFVQTLLILKKIIFNCEGRNRINDSIKILSDNLLKDANNQWSVDLVDNKINSGFILGRGVGFALSNEISLKFKELCQEMIEPFSSAEVMHGPKSLIQNTFKIFTLSMNDLSGITVQKDSSEISQYTKLVYNISSTNIESQNFFFPSNQIMEFDSIVIMTKFYPWIIKYAQKKGLDPDKPRYLTKITETF